MKDCVFYTKERDEQIASLDPLHLDGILTQELPAANTEKDIDKVRKIIKKAKKEISRIKDFNEDEAKAAIRDLGILMGTATRFRLNHSEFPSIEEGLSVCGEITGEVPSDTAYSYGNWNPFGERMRRFTTHPQEETFIRSLKKGMEALPFSIHFLRESQRKGLEDETATLLEESANYFEKILTAAYQAFRELPPQFFTEEIRPFFNPRRVKGKDYLAAGGAQMPILFLDYILWGAEEENPHYSSYLEENLHYQPQSFRTSVREMKKDGSVRKKLEERLGEGKGIHVGIANGLEGITKALLKFRKPHLKVAQKNMEIREEGAVGSGGYRTEILSYLVEKTEELSHLIEKMPVYEEVQKAC